MNPRYYFSLIILVLIIAAAAPAGVIRGSVTQLQNGSPIAGATVQGMHQGPDSTIVQATTDSAGHYILQNLAPGSWELHCSYEQFGAQYPGYPNLGYADTLDGINFQLDLTPPLNNSIAGTVENALTHLPVANAHLTLFNSQYTFNALSDINGAYLFHGVLPDTYQISGIATGYMRSTDTTKIGVTDSTSITGLTVLLMPAPASGALSGHVFDSLSGEPLIGATITVTPMVMSQDSLYPLTTVTDSNGYYALTMIPADIYTVYCETEGYQSVTIHDYPIDTGKTLNFFLPRLATGSISGHVTRGGVPYQGVTVQFYSNDGPYHYFAAVTDSEGHYTKTLPVGQYLVLCIRPDGGPTQFYHSDSTSWATPVQVVANSVTDSIDFQLSPAQHMTVTVSGTVTDQHSAALAGATVQVWADTLLPFDSSASSRTAVTDAQGHYQISMSLTTFGAFQFTVSATKDLYSQQLFDHVPVMYLAHVFSISGDSTISDIDFTLDSMSVLNTNSISGRVTTTSGAPIAGAIVYAIATNDGEMHMAISDTGGSYHLTQLLDKSFVISFNAAGFVGKIYDNVTVWENATIVEANGNVSGIDAMLEGVSRDSLGGSVAGRIHDDQGHAIAGVLVTVSNGANKTVNSYTTATDGSYLLDELHGGTYILTGTRPGYASSSTTVTVPSQPAGRVAVDISLSMQTVLASVSLNIGWNLVSVPGQPAVPLTTSLYPAAASKAFKFNGTYGVTDSISFGAGYWVKFDTASVVTLRGIPASTGSFDVHKGWNLIGSIGSPVPVSSITSSPGGMITTGFFEYNGGYNAVQTITPGKGYWVKVGANGQILLSRTSAAAPVNRIRIIPTSELPPAPPSSVVQTESAHFLPRTYALKQNYPNPFNPSTNISYEIPADGHVRLAIYNTLGQEIATLVDHDEKAGLYTVQFDGSELSSGVYFCRMVAGNYSGMLKLILMR